MTSISNVSFRRTIAFTVLAGLTVAVGTHNPSFAAGKPAGAKAAGSAFVKDLYSGNSWKWSKGGAYYAKTGKLIAVWDGSVGLGSWSVSGSGTLCNNATWYWDDNGLVQKKEKNCWKHVFDKDGNLWRHDKKDGWHKPRLRRISSGDKYSRKANRIKKKLGI